VNRLVLSIIASLATLSCSPMLAQAPAATPRPVAQQQTAQPAAPASILPNTRDSVKFAVLGDTGTGGSAQYQIAKLLNEARARFTYDFVIMLGDNMYGSEGPSDFVKKFETPYKPILDADVKFYASLGNHDDPAQRFYKPFNMDGKRFYTFRKGDVEFFVLDSTYMSPMQIEWVKQVLPKSDAKWKIPYFHHPLYSSGEKHGSEEDLRTLLEPVFLSSGVDVVFAGHEHFYERMKPQKGIHYITQGGSAKLREGNIRVGSAMTAKGFDTDNSFTLIEIVDDDLYFETISRRGQVVDAGRFQRREVTEGESR
jgi:predicted phosphodiesterase